MIEKVYGTIKKYELLERGECVVVALSGGPDSVALLSALQRISPKLKLDLIVAHFNHGLRGRESDEDEKFCRTLAKSLGLTFCAGKMNLRKKRKGDSPEDFYRRERYNFLEKISRDYKAHKIALGHHLQDQAETVLINLLRGSGLEGLKGFLPKRDGRIIRPLIEISRKEIIHYLENSGISYRQDTSNQDSSFLRNRIRLELIPCLRDQYNPKIEENLAQMTAILRNEDEFIKRHVAKAMQSPAIQKSSSSISLKLSFVKRLPPAIRWRLFKTMLEDLCPTKNGISFTHVMSLDSLLEKKESGKKVLLPRKIEARREYDHLILEIKKTPPKRTRFQYVLDVPGKVYIKEKNLTIKAGQIKNQNIDLGSKNKIYMDMDKIHFPIMIRNRRDGDRFQPLGMTGHQKIKKYLIDHKILPSQRNDIMLFVDKLSVVCIENRHLNNRVKITSKTKNVLKLEIMES